MAWTADELEGFIRHVDTCGGPGQAAETDLWRDFAYSPSVKIDQELDPFGEEYTSQQIALYEELAGHSYSSVEDELTPFDIETHVYAPNPYNGEPADMALHIQRLTRALRYADMKRGENLLDMGCGWGLTSELCAYLGLKVTAVDINPSFTELVRRRAERGARNVLAETSTFEDYVPPEPVDMVLFYECLHHAVRPWVAVERAAAGLAEGGRLVLAGEPFNDHWWKSWGMRLDPISVYCIRKFGWFESGWSLDYMRQVLHRAGLVPYTSHDPDPLIGTTMVAKKLSSHIVPAAICRDLFQPTGCFLDGDYLIFLGAGLLRLTFPHGVTSASLHLQSFRGRPLRVHVAAHETVLFSGEAEAGPLTVVVPRSADLVPLTITVERWVPSEEFGTPDNRVLGMHLSAISFHK